MTLSKNRGDFRSDEQTGDDITTSNTTDSLAIALLRSSRLHGIKINHIGDVPIPHHTLKIALLLLSLLSNRLLQEIDEGLLDVGSKLRARFKVVHTLLLIKGWSKNSDATRLRPLLDIFLRHLAVGLRQIALVAHDHEGEVEGIGGRSSDKELVLPLLQALEGLQSEQNQKWNLRIGQVKRQNAAIRTSVESRAQTLETLLTGSVPNLQMNDSVPEGT